MDMMDVGGKHDKDEGAEMAPEKLGKTDQFVVVEGVESDSPDSSQNAHQPGPGVPPKEEVTLLRQISANILTLTRHRGCSWTRLMIG